MGRSMPGAFLLAVLPLFSLSASDVVWTATGSGDNISDASHWGGAVDLTGGTDTATLSSGSQTGMIVDQDVFFAGLKLRVNTSGMTFAIRDGNASNTGGYTIKLGAGGITDVTTVGRYAVIWPKLEFSEDCEIACTGTQPVYFYGQIAATDPSNLPTLTKTGGQNLMTGFHANNSTFTGPIVVKAGALIVQGTADLGPSGTITLKDNGQFHISGDSSSSAAGAGTGVNPRSVVVDASSLQTYPIGSYLRGNAWGTQSGSVAYHTVDSGVRLMAGCRLTMSGGVTNAVEAYGDFLLNLAGNASTVTTLTATGIPWILPYETLLPKDCTVASGVSGRMVLAVAGNRFAAIGHDSSEGCWKTLQLRTDVDNALNDASMPVNLGAGAVMDLNGTVQRIGRLKTAWSGSTPAVVTNSSSSAAATLCISQTGDTEAQEGVFAGKLNIRKSGSTDFVISTPQPAGGDIAVEEGGITFTSSGSWTNCATLSLSDGTRCTISAAGALGRDTQVSIGDTARIAFAEGCTATQTVSAIWIGGEACQAGLYSAKALDGVVQDTTHFSGDGVLEVLNSAGLQIEDEILVVTGVSRIGAGMAVGTFTNVTIISGAKLYIDAADLFADGMKSFTIEDGGQLVLPVGVTFPVVSFTYDGTAFSGSLTGSDNAAPGYCTTTEAISGEGHIYSPWPEVAPVSAIWTGGGGDYLTTNQYNWGGTLPDLSGGTTLAAFASAGTRATVAGGMHLNGIEFTTSGQFDIYASDSSDLLRIGAGGITLGTAAGTAYKNIYLPVFLESYQSWHVCPGSMLPLNMSPAAPLRADRTSSRTLTISGGGSVFLNGQNSDYGGRIVVTYGTLYASGIETLGDAGPDGSGELQLDGGRLLMQRVPGSSGYIGAYISKPVRVTKIYNGNATETSVIETFAAHDATLAGPVSYTADPRPLVSHGDGSMTFSGGVTGSTAVRMALKGSSATAGKRPRITVTGKPWISTGLLRPYDCSPTPEGLYGEVVFSVASNSFARIGDSWYVDAGGTFWNNSDMRTTVDFAFDKSSMPVYFGNNSTWDLVGTSQRIGGLYLRHSSGRAPCVTNSAAVAATLHINQTEETWTQKGTLSGNIDLVMDGTKAMTITNEWSAVGSVTLRGGGIVFSENGSWRGATNISVSGSTTVLSVSNAVAIGRTTGLTLSNGAKVEIGDGVSLRVGKLLVDGDPMPAGVYTAASRPDVVSGGGELCIGSGLMVIFK